MNFGNKPMSFGFGRKSADNVPKSITTKARGARQCAALREASAVLAVLPKPGEALHAIMTGRYDVTDIVEALIGRLGPISDMRAATLSFNKRNVSQVETWLKTGQVVNLEILCSKFFQDHNPDIFAAMHEVVGQRLAASRNHCKVITMQFADGKTLIMEGSANLRTNSNREQFVLVNDAKLYSWHSEWISEQVKRAST